MSKQTARALSILFAFFSVSALRESFKILQSGDYKLLAVIALVLTAGFIWTSIHFWKKSKKGATKL